MKEKKSQRPRRRVPDPPTQKRTARLPIRRIGPTIADQEKLFERTLKEMYSRIPLGYRDKDNWPVGIVAKFLTRDESPVRKMVAERRILSFRSGFHQIDHLSVINYLRR